MAGDRDEVIAEIVWRYVEHLRAEGSSGPLTAAELDELAGLLRTAGDVPESLNRPDAACSRAEVRSRVQQILAETARPQRAAPAPPRRPAGPLFGFRIPQWGFGGALAA